MQGDDPGHDQDDATDELADAVRRAIRATRVTRVHGDERAKAIELIDRASAILSADAFAGPHCQVGFDMAEAGFAIDAQPHQFFPYSPIIGPRNPLAPPVRFEVMEDRSIRGSVRLTESYNGPPWDVAHGGVIAAIFDELLGTATIMKNGGGFTGRLTVHYRKPTPLFEELTLRSWVDHESGRKIVAKGEISVASTGVVTAEADGLFIQGGSILRTSDDTPGTATADDGARTDSPLPA